MRSVFSIFLFQADCLHCSMFVHMAELERPGTLELGFLLDVRCDRSRDNRNF